MRSETKERVVLVEYLREAKKTMKSKNRNPKHFLIAMMVMILANNKLDFFTKVIKLRCLVSGSMRLVI